MIITSNRELNHFNMCFAKRYFKKIKLIFTINTKHLIVQLKYQMYFFVRNTFIFSDKIKIKLKTDRQVYLREN